MASRLKYVGWQVGVTYQTCDREGLDGRYLRGLLTEMRDNGMNLISFMMISHALNDSRHDGYTWPVRNPKPKCYVDQNCANAAPDKEFLREIIEQAGDLGFHVNLFMNGFWWNPDRVRQGYPNIRTLDNDAVNHYYHHCSDNRDTWALARDEVQDLLSFYSHPPVNSYGFEMMGQGGCTCPDTMTMFENTLKTAERGDSEKPECKQNALCLWRAMRSRQVLDEFVISVKKTRPSVELWHHGYMELGDYGGYRFSPDSYRMAGIDVALPCIHTIVDETRLKAVIESSEDFPTCLHVDTRDTPTENYQIPLKTPRDILNMGKWIEDNHRPNLLGAMFFNEVATSKENKRAVYDVVQRWRRAGLY